MNTMNFTATNSELILPEGCELAIVKDGKVIQQGKAVNDAAFNATADACFDLFGRYMDAKKIKKFAQEQEGC